MEGQNIEEIELTHEEATALAIPNHLKRFKVNSCDMKSLDLSRAYNLNFLDIRNAKFFGVMSFPEYGTSSLKNI